MKGLASIDHFDLIEVLGTGAAADIYRAVDRRTGRIVTLKVPRRATLGNAELLRRFRREAATTAQLDHPLIQHNLDERNRRSRLYLALEYLPGSNLPTVMANEATPFPENRVRLWLSDVAEALDHVHSRGFVHGDLKPENLVIGPDRRARLIDFGDSTGMGGRRRRWALMSGLQGTPEYLSPEQILGRSATPTTDLYALGVIGFELLTGRPPFVGDELEATLNAHLKAALPLTLAARDDVSTDLTDLVHDLLRRRPEVRPPSSREVLERLHRPRPSATEERKPRDVNLDPELRGSATSAARRQMVTAVTSITLAFIGIVGTVIAASFLLR